MNFLQFNLEHGRMLGKYVLTFRKTAVCRGLKLTMPCRISLLSVTHNKFIMNISKVDYITKLISLHPHSCKHVITPMLLTRVSNTCIPLGVTHEKSRHVSELPLSFSASFHQQIVGAISKICTIHPLPEQLH